MACQVPSNVALGPPVVNAVTPNQTQSGASTAVTITGAKFFNVSDVGLYQWSTELYHLSFTVVSDAQITATVPNMINCGSYQIIVNTSLGSSATPFSVRPVVTSISPAIGPLTGGTKVTVNGVGLGGDIYFGSTKATVGVSEGCTSSTQCVVDSPASVSVGAVDVVANVGGVLSAAHLGDVFMYTEHPALTKLQLPDLSPGITSLVGSVFLNGNAPKDGALVTLTNSDQSVVTTVPTVNIPEGLQYTEVPLTVVPTPTLKSATLTAVYQGSYVTATLNEPAWPPIMMGPSGTVVAVGESGTLTVTLNRPAPQGDAVVSISFDIGSAVAAPQTVRIPAGNYGMSFTIVGKQPSGPESVIAYANYNGSLSAPCYLSVVKCAPPKSGCGVGRHWDYDVCTCKAGILKLPPPL